jgi:hypothetical protein
MNWVQLGISHWELVLSAAEVLGIGNWELVLSAAEVLGIGHRASGIGD